MKLLTLIPVLVCLGGCETDYGRIQRLEREAALARTALWRAEQRLDSLEGEVRVILFQERCATDDDAGACWMSLLWQDVDVSEHCRDGDSSDLCSRHAEVSDGIEKARTTRELAERALAGSRP